MDLKRGIDLAVAAVVKDIEKRAKKVGSSAEVAQCRHHLGERRLLGRPDDRQRDARRSATKASSPLRKPRRSRTELEVVEGMQFDRGYLPLLHHQCREDDRRAGRRRHASSCTRRSSGLQAMLPVLEALSSRPAKPLVIVAEDIEGEALPPSS